MLARRRELVERAGLDVVERTEPLPEEDVAALGARLQRVERRLEALGAVNPLAREEYEAERARAEETAEQIADLEASLRELGRLVRDLSRTIAERFDATFAEVERGFAEVVETVFPGGRGRLRLVDAAPAAAPTRTASPPRRTPTRRRSSRASSSRSARPASASSRCRCSAAARRRSRRSPSCSP